ncbi:MBL fold metallo-hydrolase [Paraglaciecola sp. MB-3u-78]|uniref:MBL fold metallo-hydrolase n=1 Tax=Paraglaciecola sp. MB-3u-78 TaxID=2058332 RepID=UPI000C34B896|nr:MBL fold metallo-hydrolase [Paraglaciecola sp. MB-3u-78]PKG98325.1 Zn-dependent hydrolase [Paraglaciecola sp. MB-3u-78]
MKIHGLKGHVQSIYLVEYPEKLLLLDGCCRADISMLEQFITVELSRPFSDLKLIVVTHMHPDHAGAAHKLRKKTGCEIVSANMPTQWYKGLNGRFMHLVDIALATWVASRMGKTRKNLWYSPYLKIDYALADQAKLPGFDEWCVMLTPGHTDRDLSVLHLPSKRIYVADLLVKVKDRFIPPIPVNYPNQYRASILKVQALQPASIMLAHGGEVTLSERDFDHVLTVAPRKPFTIWTPAKNKLKRLLLRKKG